MNAALQCLTHTHGLQKYFRFCSHAYTSKSQSSRQKLLMSFAHWFERDWGKSVSAPYHSPEDILRSVQQLNPVFQGYAQQDSQEFLRCVLDNMHEELRREVPDDLNGFLRRSFGIETPGESLSTQATPSSSSSRGDPRPAGSSSSSSSTARSTTTQLMKLCQRTEGVTDVGEIRLPEAAASPGGGHACDDEPRADIDAEGEGKASTAGDGEKEEEKTHFTSIISELYQGKAVSIVRCLECQRKSRTTEVFYDVSVPIPNVNEVAGSGSDLPGREPPGGQRGAAWGGLFGGIPGKMKSWFYDKGVEVTDCLRKFCTVEYLTGKDKYFCEHCKRKTDGEKRMLFKELPECLCIHIKRFRYDAGWFNGTKNSKVVTFPVNRSIDLSSFCDEPPPNPVEYKLVGLVQHIGSMSGGHYIAYCQHKRKPQDWYEFDDMTVSPVAPETVERAEPYVLFFQRLPSRGNKLDRQTFKSDQRRVQASIRAHLMSVGTSPKNRADDASQSQLAQTATEEMILHGPQVRSLYRKPPAELDIVFVSKHWYVRLTSMSQPGPLDNYKYLCEHQLLGAYSAEMAAEPFIPISRGLWQSLVQKYGGGPVINALELCTKCQTYLRAYNDRKQAEYDLVSKYDTKDTGDGKHWYLVDALWVNKWKRYVKAEHVTDIADMSQPGAISNDRLWEKDQPGKPRSNLRLRIDYIGVNARVWWLFMHVHGAGGSNSALICREELDIYSAECPAEVELNLDELHGKADRGFTRRTSWEFVDHCKGDLEMWEQIYGDAESKEPLARIGAERPEGRLEARPEDGRGLHEEGLDEEREAPQGDECQQPLNEDADRHEDAR